LTISAVAERACVKIAAAHGWTIDFTPNDPWTAPDDDRPVGLRFTERMAGDITTISGDEAPFSFVLTIASEDLDAMLSEPSHAARLVGTVDAPSLSPKPIEARGEFHLFIEDPKHVDERRMTYALDLEAEDGKRWFAFGYKIVRDRSITHGWHDATTLYLMVYEGEDDRGDVVGEGELHISFVDALRLARTIDVVRAKSVVERLSAIARFGAFFFGTLWDHYGGVFGRSTAFDPKAPPRKKRPLRAPAPEAIALATDDGVSLPLARFAGDGDAVLLVHDLGVSSRLFTLDTIETCLVEYLVAKGYDVFLLDARTSTDVGQKGTLLDVARHDIPAALAAIAKTTKKRASIVAQGWGALATHAAMIEGVNASDVRSIVALQAGLHVEASEAATIAAGLHVDDVLDAIGVDSLGVDAREGEPWWQKLYDDALRALPEPKDERCESEVCRRIQFVYGLPFVHAHLDEATHDALHEVYGAAPIVALEDLAAMVRKGHVPDLGSSWWPFWRPRRRVNLARLALPITYLHGDRNRTILPHATEKTIAMLSKANDPKLYAREVLAGYGHLDPIVGRDAAREVYPKIVAALERGSR
jgi:cholesterol oxidase